MAMSTWYFQQKFTENRQVLPPKRPIESNPIQHAMNSVAESLAHIFSRESRKSPTFWEGKFHSHLEN